PLDRADGASPKAVLDLLPKAGNDEARAAIAKLKAPDDVFARALAATHAVTGYTLRDVGGGRLPELKGDVVVRGDAAALEGVSNFRSAAGAVATLEIASSGIGALNLQTDSDGKLRGLPFAYRLGGKAV